MTDLLTDNEKGAEGPAEQIADPYIDFSKFGTEELAFGICIEELWVPEHLRGQGIGTKKYEEFERTLPTSTQIVTLIAADLGTGNTERFWSAQGFTPVYDHANAPAGTKEIYIHMHKGVNGHPAPATLPWSEYDANYMPSPVAPPACQQAQHKRLMGP